MSSKHLFPEMTARRRMQCHEEETISKLIPRVLAHIAFRLFNLTVLISLLRKRLQLTLMLKMFTE
jgi:hypothetical protein